MHAVPFSDLPGPGLPSAAFFHFTTDECNGAVCPSAARQQPRALGGGQGGATVPSSPHPKRLGGWNSFPVPATLLWLSAGKSGTSQPPNGNGGDTNRSFKTQNIWSVTFSVWANRALLIKPRQIPAEAKVDLTVLRRRVRRGLQLG